MRHIDISERQPEIVRVFEGANEGIEEYIRHRLRSFVKSFTSIYPSAELGVAWSLR